MLEIFKTVPKITLAKGLIKRIDSVALKVFFFPRKFFSRPSKSSGFWLVPFNVTKKKNTQILYERRINSVIIFCVTSSCSNSVAGVGVGGRRFLLMRRRNVAAQNRWASPGALPGGWWVGGWWVGGWVRWARWGGPPHPPTLAPPTPATRCAPGRSLLIGRQIQSGLDG